jgi:hypothetical protein
MGYARRRNGQLSYQVRSRGWQRDWGGRDQNGRHGIDPHEDHPLGDEFRLSLSLGASLPVSCGRHNGRLFEDDFRIAGLQRRKVMVTPEAPKSRPSTSDD